MNKTGTLTLHWEKVITAGDPNLFQIDPAAASIAIGCTNGLVSIVSIDSAEPLFETRIPLETEARLRCLRYSIDAKHLFLATATTVFELEISPQATLRTIASQTGVIQCMLPSPNGQAIFTGSIDQRIRCFNISTGELITLMHPSNGTVRALEVSPDGKYLASQGWWRNDLWDVNTFQRINALTDRPVGGNRLGFSPDSARLYSDSQAGIRIWSRTKVPIWHDIPAHEKYVGKLAASTGSPRLVSIGARERSALWDTQSMRHLRDLGTAGQAWETAINDTGSEVALMSETGVLEFINSDTGSVRLRLDTNTRDADINFVDNDRLLAISTFKPNVQFRDVATGELFNTIDLPRADLFEMQPSADGKLLFILQRNNLNMLDVASMKLTALPQNQIQARAIYPNHDGSLLAVGLFNGEVQLWETATRKLRHTMVAHRETVSHVSISTDGALIASCAGDAILLWDTVEGTLLMTLRELEVSDTKPSFPSYLKFIESNTKLVVGYSTGKMEVYDLQSLDNAVVANTRKPADIAASAGVTPPPPDPTTDAAEMRRWLMRVGKAFTGGEQNKVPQDK